MPARFKRRQAIEPIIGHLKADHRMDRCHLKGSEGDALHAMLCVADYVHWLAAADDRPERPGPFVVPVAGERFGGLVGENWLKSLAAIDGKSQINAGRWLEMNFCRDDSLLQNVSTAKTIANVFFMGALSCAVPGPQQ